MSIKLASYTPIGSEYKIIIRNETHFIVECPVNKKLLMRRAMSSMIPTFIILLMYTLVPFALIGQLLSNMMPVFIILPVLLVAVIGVIPAGVYSTISRFTQPFTIELDKVANKLQLCMPNPLAAQGSARRNVYANLGQFITTAWDLDKIVFRECLASNYSGPGAFSLKIAFKNKFIILATTAPWPYPFVFFAGDHDELAQSLLGEIDRFMRGNSFTSDGWQGAGNEQAYRNRD